MSPAVFVSIDNHDNFWLKGIADVKAAWRQNERGNGFFGKGSIPYPGNRSIEITLNVRVRPFGNLSHFRDFPEDIQTRGNLIAPGAVIIGGYQIQNGRLGVLIDAGTLRGWLERNQDNPIHFKPVMLAQGTDRVHIQMNVSLGVRSAPPEPVGDIPEWDVQFFQGGLPSLGKRRP